MYFMKLKMIYELYNLFEYLILLGRVEVWNL